MAKTRTTNYAIICAFSFILGWFLRGKLQDGTDSYEMIRDSAERNAVIHSSKGVAVINSDGDAVETDSEATRARVAETPYPLNKNNIGKIQKYHTEKIDSTRSKPLLKNEKVSIGEYCDAVLAHGLDFLGPVPQISVDGAMIPTISHFSQFHQDAFMYQVLLYNNQQNTPGTFAEVASAWPQALSNSLFLEACLGWSGLCIDGDRAKNALIQEQRACVSVENCISDKNEIMSFASNLKSGTNGVTSTLRGDGTSSSRFYDLQCFPLDKIIKENGLSQIDFLSLDIESFEPTALRGIQNTDVRIDMIVMEVFNCCRLHTKSSEAQKKEIRNNQETVLAFFKKFDYVPIHGFPYSAVPEQVRCTKTKKYEVFGRTLEEVFFDPLFNEDRSGRWATSDILFVRRDSKFFSMFSRYKKCEKV